MDRPSADAKLIARAIEQGCKLIAKAIEASNKKFEDVLRKEVMQDVCRLNKVQLLRV